ncbi:hypothetical protein Y032_0546g3260 [Ancylostoma ceylanicum]|nr:hypothetical protein Y032_0546g3260 [Ancylostoma ceylanicum]
MQYSTMSREEPCESCKTNNNQRERMSCRTVIMGVVFTMSLALAATSAYLINSLADSQAEMGLRRYLGFTMMALSLLLLMVIVMIICLPRSRMKEKSIQTFRNFTTKNSQITGGANVETAFGPTCDRQILIQDTCKSEEDRLVQIMESVGVM